MTAISKQALCGQLSQTREQKITFRVLSTHKIGNTLYKQVRFVSVNAEPCALCVCGGGSALWAGVSQWGGVLHDNNDDTDVTP